MISCFTAMLVAARAHLLKVALAACHEVDAFTRRPGGLPSASQTTSQSSLVNFLKEVELKFIPKTFRGLGVYRSFRRSRLQI